jgi:hypothetical protein
VNKRAVANLVLRNSRVNCWHKNTSLLYPSVMYSDTFMQYRQNLIPSGAHKVYVAALVLKDIAQSGLAIFLPDIEIGKKVVRIYDEVQRLGARAHIGSRYYTDEPPALSQSEVDEFLPIAAYYVQNKMNTSSIASSPHLSLENADAAPAQWKQIITATVRMSAYDAPIDQVTSYLKLAGATGMVIKLDTDENRQKAVEQNSEILSEISALFK